MPFMQSQLHASHYTLYFRRAGLFCHITPSIIPPCAVFSAFRRFSFSSAVCRQTPLSRCRHYFHFRHFDISRHSRRHYAFITQPFRLLSYLMATRASAFDFHDAACLLRHCAIISIVSAFAIFHLAGHCHFATTRLPRRRRCQLQATAALIRAPPIATRAADGHEHVAPPDAIACAVHALRQDAPR